MMHLCTAAPDVAALALSGDWAAEFLSGPESTSAPGLASLSDAADADWTREFISEAAGSPRLNMTVCVRKVPLVRALTVCLPASLSQILDAGLRSIWSSRRRSCGWAILETRRANG